MVTPVQEVWRVRWALEFGNPVQDVLNERGMFSADSEHTAQADAAEEKNKDTCIAHFNNCEHS